MLSLSRSGVDSSCPLFGTTVVVVSFVPIFDRAAHYSTASLKLITSRLCSSWIQIVPVRVVCRERPGLDSYAVVSLYIDLWQWLSSMLHISQMSH